MGKRKEGHSSNQTMTSFSFVALTKVSAARLHYKGMLTKEIKTKLSLSKVMYVFKDPGNLKSTKFYPTSIRLPT